jgi:hypothetical protein
MERHSLRLSENGVLRRIFVHKRRKWREVGGDYMMRSFITLTLHKILFG